MTDPFATPLDHDIARWRAEIEALQQRISDAIADLAPANSNIARRRESRLATRTLRIAPVEHLTATIRDDGRWLCGLTEAGSLQALCAAIGRDVAMAVRWSDGTAAVWVENCRVSGAGVVS